MYSALSTIFVRLVVSQDKSPFRPDRKTVHRIYTLVMLALHVPITRWNEQMLEEKVLR
jgi:hypothetical protein